MSSTVFSAADASLEVFKRGQCKEVTAGAEEWSIVQDGELDSIIVRGEAAGKWARDPVTAICEWRRALKREGTLAVVIPVTGGTTGLKPEILVTLIDLIGGFLHGETRPIDAVSDLFVGTRSTVAEIRMPLSIHGALFAKAADHSKARSELYFQIATILLQARDYELAAVCYKKLQGVEERSSEALFGLGMCEVCLGHSAAGLELLERARVIDPQNAEIQRWIGLVRNESARSPGQPARVAESAVRPQTKVAGAQAASGSRPAAAPSASSRPGAANPKQAGAPSKGRTSEQS